MQTFLENNVPITQEKFSPFFPLFGTVGQTVSGAVLRSGAKVNWDTTEDIDLADNGQVHLYWLHGAQNSLNSDSDRPTVLFLPGLTGNNESNYIQNFARHLQDVGFRFVNFYHSSRKSS